MMEFFNSQHPKARKPYTCELCGKQIQAGESYHRFSGKYDGSMFDLKYCRNCEMVIDAYCSEAGEAAGILQKEYQGHTFDPEHMKKELGDCLWMIVEACDMLGFTLSDVMQTNIDKLKARYPEGFDAEHSLHRKAGDI